MRSQILPELLRHHRFVIGPIAWNVILSEAKNLSLVVSETLRSLSLPQSDMLAFKHSILHAMRSQILAEFFGHHGFIVRPVADLHFNNGVFCRGGLVG
jgi:hypothetical protein